MKLELQATPGTDLDRADDLLWIIAMWLRTTLLLTAVALLLSLAGIYAVLSFTVARRTREIGVRVALGASRRLVLTAIFRRPLIQVGLGIVGGATLIAVGAMALARTTQFQEWPRGLSVGQIAMLLAYAAFMLVVCLLACIVPTQRALRVEPTVAMRVDSDDARIVRRGSRPQRVDEPGGRLVVSSAANRGSPRSGAQVGSTRRYAGV